MFNRNQILHGGLLNFLLFFDVPGFKDVSEDDDAAKNGDEHQWR